MQRLALITIILAAACSRDRSQPSESSSPPPAAAAATERTGQPAPAAQPDQHPALLLAQAQFVEKAGEIEPGPAKLVILRRDDHGWTSEILEDEQSNVFHKAIVWHGGILTIGGGAALLRHWVRSGDDWKPKTLWRRSWHGKVDRLRDMELGDVDGDDRAEIVLATHDRGVVAIGDQGDGDWTFTELGKTDDVFVHEIEIGDVDGDGASEIYSTPSARNRYTGVQAGSVIRYDWTGDQYRKSQVARWDDTHAKEVLVTDADGDGTDELYAVREAVIDRGDDDVPTIATPVRVLRLDRQDDGSWSESVIASVDDRGARFLVPGDVDGDGDVDLILATMHAGLWLLRHDGDSFHKVLIDAESSGFEHATHVADLDGDGQLEIYVAADDQGELRRYVWKDNQFARRKLADIPAHHITWSIQHGTL
jgi:hypothetical protein